MFNFVLLTHDPVHLAAAFIVLVLGSILMGCEIRLLLSLRRLQADIRHHNEELRAWLHR